MIRASNTKEVIALLCGLRAVRQFRPAAIPRELVDE